jgi:hypothetical protein
MVRPRFGVSAWLFLGSPPSRAPSGAPGCAFWAPGQGTRCPGSGAGRDPALGGVSLPLWGEGPQPSPPSREGTTPLTLTLNLTPKGSTTRRARQRRQTKQLQHHHHPSASRRRDRRLPPSTCPRTSHRKHRIRPATCGRHDSTVERPPGPTAISPPGLRFYNLPATTADYNRKSR